MHLLAQVCKHFLHAIEKGIYGWFWECPSGDKCIYRHALPPGFVFKKQLKEQEELQPQDTITLEELVETEVRACTMHVGVLHLYMYVSLVQLFFINTCKFVVHEMRYLSNFV